LTNIREAADRAALPPSLKLRRDKPAPPSRKSYMECK